MAKICFHADNDINSDAQAVNAAMVAENADAYCFVGDGPYATSGTGWVTQQKKHFDDKKDKMIWSRGNHDTESSESWKTQDDMEAWFPESKSLGIGERTWLISKQVGNVYVISMDTEDMDVEFERDQFNFVKAELAKAKQLRTAGTIDWIVVLFHKPFFTLKSSHSPYTAVRFLYKDLFRDAQVDFCVSGHNHNTQLWKPMIPNQSQANGEGEQLFKFASDGKTLDFAQDHGAAFIVTGHSAHEWNVINDSGSGVANVMHYRDDGEFGYTVIETDGKMAKVMSKDVTGKIHFEYAVTRDGAIGPPPPPDNKPPIANAGLDQIVKPKTTVMLNGSQSTDPDGTILQSYKWEQTSGPTVTLNPTNTAIASFTTPELTTTPPPPPTGNNYKFSYKFGKEGNGDGEFIDPHDVTFDKDDNVYIPDRERNDIQVFTHDGKFIRKFGGPGSGPGQFNVPYSVQMGPDDNLFICDRENSRVQKIDKNGTFIQEWKEMNGKELDMPEDLAFDKNMEFLYFTDTGNNRIVKCTKDMQFVKEWGSKGNGDSQFDHPHGIDVGPDGNVYVNSGYQPYIKKFSPDGQFIKKWGSEGTGEGQFLMFLEHLDVEDTTGRVFIINNNIRPYVFIFDSEGKYLGKFGSEEEGSADGEFKEPEHVTIDKQGRAFCVDSGNFRIQVFEADGTATPTAAAVADLPLTFQLTVTDDKGAQASDSVTITVSDTTPPPPPTELPVAKIKPEFPSGMPGATIVCDGTESTHTVTYAWSVLDGATIIGNANQSLVQIKLPDDINAKPKVVLNAINKEGQSNSQTKDIQIVAGPPPPPPPGDKICPRDYHYDESLSKCIPDLEPEVNPVCPAGTKWNAQKGICEGTVIPPTNKPPIANAGDDKTVKAKDIVTLNGSKSSDPEGVILAAFKWTQLAGTTVTLAQTDTIITNFKAPDTAGQLVFQLEVTDDRGLKATDTVTITVSEITPPPPPEDPIAQLVLPTSAQPKQTDVIADASASVADDVQITETTSENIQLVDAGKWKKKFNIPDKNNFSIGIKAVAQKGTKQSVITKNIQVSGGTNPPPPDGEVLWDSNVHLKTGQKYTITDTHGDQSPDGKGVFMAASGNPRLHVDADGTFHLEADSGHGRVYIKARNYNARMEGELMFEDNAIRNTTLRLRSRHGEGGACENRFGGFGVTVEREEQLAETSTERCHNEHSNTVKNPLEKHIEVGQWIKFKYSCFSSADKKAINQKLEYDYNDGQGFKTVIEEKFTSVEPHFMDEAKFNEESYAWLRVNNESTGKVAYRNVRIIKI
jgi:predicted phosphodiesterase